MSDVTLKPLSSRQLLEQVEERILDRAIERATDSTQKRYYWDCPECGSRYFNSPSLTLVVKNGVVVAAPPICEHCFEKCRNGHAFEYAEYCECGLRRKRIRLIRHELDPDDPTFGLSSTGSTSYPTTSAGDTNVEANNSPLTLNYIYAQAKFTTSVDLTIVSITVYQASAPGTSTHVHFGIYPDSSNSPAGQSLVSGSDSGAITLNNSTGLQTYTYATPFYLTAGTYWLCLIGDTTVANFFKEGGTATSSYYKAQTYGALPATFPSNPTSSTGPHTLYFNGVQIKGYAKATKAILSQDASSITSFSFYTHATGNAKLAFYQNSAGAPGSRIWYSAAVACSASAWNTANVSDGTPTSLTSLSAGTYWLTWKWDSVNSGPSYTTGTSGDGYYVAAAYASAWPDPFGAGTATAEKWSLYGTYTPVTYQISGITRDSGGNPLGSCTVWLFRTSDETFIASTISDASTGAYAFTGLPDTSTQYFIRAYKDGSPNVFGTTDRNLVAS